MKRYIVFVAMCAVYFNCYAQSKISEAAYKNKGLKITTYHGGKLIGSGSAFVIKQDDGYFLVTNYHLLTNLKAQDTAEFDAPSHRVSPTSMVVSFNGKMPAKTYPLTKNKARTFFSPVAGSSKTTTDLAFYRLKDIPQRVKLDTVDLRQTANEYTIDKPSKLFIYGAQLVKIDYETTLSLFGQITGKETHPLSGVSGAPVFAFTGGKKSFVGMGAFTKKNADGTKSFVIITKGTIRSSFSTLSPR